jgi:F-type H+-transporting ATPase subunit epsilon
VAKTFRLEVVTPEGTAWKGEASALQVPSWEGYLGVLAGHAPLLCVLKSGVLTMRDASEKPRYYALKGGFMDVSGGRAIVLADAIEPAEQVDVKAAEKALAALEAPLPPPPPAAPGEDDSQRRAAYKVALEEREEARRWNEARLLAADRLSGRGAA